MPKSQRAWEQYAAEHNGLLPGPRQTFWSCKCRRPGAAANFACRIACRACGRAAAASHRNVAIAAADKALRARGAPDEATSPGVLTAWAKGPPPSLRGGGGKTSGTGNETKLLKEIADLKAQLAQQQAGAADDDGEDLMDDDSGAAEKVDPDKLKAVLDAAGASMGEDVPVYKQVQARWAAAKKARDASKPLRTQVAQAERKLERKKNLGCGNQVRASGS